jgi:CoA:oxalate CoA-transferase
VTGPLAGYRILDLSIWQQGTYATAMLADMGADVIKIESYTNPDPGRGLGAPEMGSPRRAYFDALNRGKRSITLDLKSEAGLEVFWRLVGESDVFHNNLRGGAMERLGITYESLCAHNPRIIYSTASGWGHLGPDRHVGAMDTLAQARGGFMAANTLPSGEPQASTFPQADHVGAIVSGYSIVLALLHRERSGEGQEVNTSLYGSQLCIQSYSITGALWTGITPPPRPREDRPATWTHFQAGDGKWFMIGALPADKWWAQFCEVMGAEELAAEPYATAPDRALRNREVIAKMDAVFASKPRDEWLRLFHERDLLVQPVADYLEIGADEQAWANDYLVKVADDEGRDWPIVGSPVHLSKTPAEVRALGPVLGAHTEEVVLEAGFSWPEIEALRERGAFGFPT